MPPRNAGENNALGWKIAMGLIMVLQGILTTMGFMTYQAIDTLKTAKAENSVMVNSVILPTLARHDVAIDRLTNQSNAKQLP